MKKNIEHFRKMRMDLRWHALNSKLQAKHYHTEKYLATRGFQNDTPTKTC